jgi:hypothetical protein
MSKDPFEILADEITLIRKDMDRLQRTSLDKDEAKALSVELTAALDNLSGTGEFIIEQNTKVLDERLTALSAVVVEVAKKFGTHVSTVATEATKNAVETVNRESVVAAKTLQKSVDEANQKSAAAAQDLLRGAKEAHREALRRFGGFWVWLGCVGATGAVLGLLTAFWMTGRDNAKAFGAYPGLYCRDAGGEKRELETQAGVYEVCVFWVHKIKDKAE